MASHAAVLITSLVLAAGCSGEDGEPQTTTPSARAAHSLVDAATAKRLGLTTRVPKVLVQACRELARTAAAQHVARPVYCPPLVPDVPLKIELAGGAERYRQLAEGYLVGVWSPVVKNVDANGGHWTFGAGTHAALRTWTHHPQMPLRPSRTGRITIDGAEATVFYMPKRLPAFYAGHVGLEWRTRGTTFHVTMHGFNNAERVELMATAMIRQLRRCAAPKSTSVPACDHVFRP